MDSRYKLEKQPAARLAAIAAEVVRNVARDHPLGDADFADFAAAFHPYVDRELIEARLEEANLFGNQKRVDDLRRDLARALSTIANL